MRVLGIDPGLTRCGLGVVDGRPGRPPELIGVDVIRTPADLDVARRLCRLEEEIDAWLVEHRPDTVAVERVFAQHNVQTVMGTAQAAGVAMLVAARRGIPVGLHTPSEVKAAITGSGRADKAQVTAMVTRILRLDSPPKPADAADALALAICHVWRGGITARYESAQQSARRMPPSSGSGPRSLGRDRSPGTAAAAANRSNPALGRRTQPQGRPPNAPPQPPPQREALHPPPPSPPPHAAARGTAPSDTERLPATPPAERAASATERSPAGPSDAPTAAPDRPLPTSRARSPRPAPAPAHPQHEESLMIAQVSGTVIQLGPTAAVIEVGVPAPAASAFWPWSAPTPLPSSGSGNGDARDESGGPRGLVDAVRVCLHRRARAVRAAADGDGGRAEARPGRSRRAHA